jgi:hypothetical protein
MIAMRIARTFDHAMIVGPWGDVPAAAEEAAGVGFANLELGEPRAGGPRPGGTAGGARAIPGICASTLSD